MAAIKKNINDADIKRESKIMVVDDDFDIATLVKITLQKSGFKNVFVFTKPLLALEHFKINYKDYCMVIADIRMPEMNGFEFARSVSRAKPEIKVLLMTAFDNNDDTLLDMNVKYNTNISGIIQKPVSSAKLSRMIVSQISV
jgi:two-component system cell cycle sensor histidine kinase/response regulator CckA